MIVFVGLLQNLMLRMIRVHHSISTSGVKVKAVYRNDEDEEANDYGHSQWTERWAVTRTSIFWKTVTMCLHKRILCAKVATKTDILIATEWLIQFESVVHGAPFTTEYSFAFTF